MDIYQRIKRLRQEKNWTQAELAEHLGIRQKQISAYERRTTTPSTEVLIKLAEVFDVSLDYLAFNIEGENTKVEVKDRDLLKVLETIDDYPEEERKMAKEILDLVVMKHNFQELARSH